jgi:nitrite reductase (NADH) small subunit
MITATAPGASVVNLGKVAMIPRGEGRVFQVGANSLAVFHTRDGGVFATEPTCPHKGGPLADGLVGAKKVICPLHSLVFDLGSGHPVGNGCRPLKTFPAVINDQGEILVGIEDLLAAR